MGLNSIIKPKINFTMVPNEVLCDKRLSLKAKGLWSYFLSRPDNWRFSIDRLAATMKEGKKSIQSAIKELQDCDYLYRTARYDDDAKKFDGYQYTLNFEGSDSQKVADTKGVHLKSSPPEKVATINNTDSNNTDLNNIDNSNTEEKLKSSPPVETEINKTFNIGVDAYFEFYKKIAGGYPPKFGGAEGKALKMILAYFRNSQPDGASGSGGENRYSIECLNAIFDNWDRLSKWQQDNPDIKIINSQLSNIIKVIKNGKSVSKSPVKSADWVE